MNNIQLVVTRKGKGATDFPVNLSKVRNCSEVIFIRGPLGARESFLFPAKEVIAQVTKTKRHKPAGPTGFYISGKWAPPGTFERGRKNFRDRFGC